jgi:hypothetical protein
MSIIQFFYSPNTSPWRSSTQPDGSSGCDEAEVQPLQGMLMITFLYILYIFICFYIFLYTFVICLS